MAAHAKYNDVCLFSIRQIPEAYRFMSQTVPKRKNKQSKQKVGETPVHGNDVHSPPANEIMATRDHEKKHKKQRKHDEEKERRKKKKDKKKKKQRHSPDHIGQDSSILFCWM